MGTYIGQTSQLAPAVVFDNNTYNGNTPTFHMLFKSNDSSNRLLYVTSKDGQNWVYDPDSQPSGQSTSAAPAIALYMTDTFQGETPDTFLLVGSYVANDSSKRLIYTTCNLLALPPRGWTDGVQVNQESAQWVSTLTGGVGVNDDSVHLYYISKDNSNRILETQFTP
jgi:hypothetical protein